MRMHQERPEKGRTRPGWGHILRRVLEQATARMIADSIRDLVKELSTL